MSFYHWYVSKWRTPTFHFTPTLITDRFKLLYIIQTVKLTGCIFISCFDALWIFWSLVHSFDGDVHKWIQREAVQHHTSTDPFWLGLLISSWWKSPALRHFYDPGSELNNWNFTTETAETTWHQIWLQLLSPQSWVAEKLWPKGNRSDYWTWSNIGSFTWD